MFTYKVQEYSALEDDADADDDPVFDAGIECNTMLYYMCMYMTLYIQVVCGPYLAH